MAPKQPKQPWSSHGLLHFSFKNSIHSVPSFGTDQTAPHGLIQPKHRKTFKMGVKTQVGRKSYLKEFEETPDPGVHALSSPRRTASLLDSKRSNGRIARDLREKSETLSLKPPISVFYTATASPNLVPRFWSLCLSGEDALFPILSLCDLKSNL